MKNQPYNVGLSDANLSKLQLCAKIKEYLPEFTYMESPIREDPDKRDYIVSNDKIESTGYMPQYSLDMGTQDFIKGFSILTDRKYANV
jgi:nucleoside-diphosphate-sugar epimerase